MELGLEKLRDESQWHFITQRDLFVLLFWNSGPELVSPFCSKNVFVTSWYERGREKGWPWLSKMFPGNKLWTGLDEGHGLLRAHMGAGLAKACEGNALILSSENVLIP